MKRSTRSTITISFVLIEISLPFIEQYFHHENTKYKPLLSCNRQNLATECRHDGAGSHLEHDTPLSGVDQDLLVVQDAAFHEGLQPLLRSERADSADQIPCQPFSGFDIDHRSALDFAKARQLLEVQFPIPGQQREAVIFAAQFLLQRRVDDDGRENLTGSFCKKSVCL